MKRRAFLRNSLVGLGALVATQYPFLSSLTAQDNAGDAALDVKGAIRDIHDPVIIKHDDSYYLFSTGVGVPVKRSTNLIDWRIARGGTVFQQMPEEAFAYVPGATNIWAPDISYYNDKYHLYYSVSTFGSNRSAIGLATNKTLQHDADDFEWIDHGIVVKSDYSDFYNAIDANLILDTEGVPWLSFGSHWGGIKLVQLDIETGKPAEENPTLHSLATREENHRSVEGPFIIHRNDYYYLFVSFDQCCQGGASTYNVRVGRSEAITGPYIDRDGVPMMEGGGTQITFPTDRYKGPGHNGILREGEQDYIVHHAYDVVQGGVPTLRIAPLVWDEDGWCSVATVEADD
jgi:arabinan endo-1,5-alpha-L-arabinosidase